MRGNEITTTMDRRVWVRVAQEFVMQVSSDDITHSGLTEATDQAMNKAFRDGRTPYTITTNVEVVV